MRLPERVAARRNWRAILTPRRIKSNTVEGDKAHPRGQGGGPRGSPLLNRAACEAAAPLMSRHGDQQTQPVASATFHEEVIGELSPGSEMESARSTAHHLAWIEKQGGKRNVRLDGKQQGGVYDDAKHLEFAPDDQHLVFAGKRNDKWVVILDGEERSAEYSKITSFDWQPKGGSLAYCACREKKCRLVVNGAEQGAEYEDISYPQYTRDGQRLGYLGKRGKKWVAVVDGKESGPELDEVASWGFSKDGSRFFAAARIRDWTYVVDGTAGPRFEVISPIAFSKDGKHYAYGGTEAKVGVFSKNKTRGTLVVDGSAEGSFEGSGYGGFWKGAAGVREEIVTGLRVFTPNFHGLSNPAFTSEGELVYAARRGEGDVAVFVRDKAGPGFQEIVSPVIFTTDEKHFAYIAQDGEEFVEVRDNQPGSKFAGKRTLSFVGWITISEDGKHLAYSIVRGGGQFAQGRTNRALRRVVVDGQTGPEYDARTHNVRTRSCFGCSD